MFSFVLSSFPFYVLSRFSLSFIVISLYLLEDRIVKKGEENTPCIHKQIKTHSTRRRRRLYII